MIVTSIAPSISRTSRRMPRSAIVNGGSSGSSTDAAAAARSVPVQLPFGAGKCARQDLHFRQQVAEVLGMPSLPSAALHPAVHRLT